MLCKSCISCILDNKNKCFCLYINTLNLRLCFTLLLYFAVVTTLGCNVHRKMVNYRYTLFMIKTSWECKINLYFKQSWALTLFTSSGKNPEKCKYARNIKKVLIYVRIFFYTTHNYGNWD